MCVVSNVGDWGKTNWPQPWSPLPQVLPDTWPADTPTRREWDDFNDLIKKAKEIDQATGQPDCEAEEKTAWMQAMEERIAALEGSRRPFFDFGLHLETVEKIVCFLNNLEQDLGQTATLSLELEHVAIAMREQLK